MSAPAPPPYLTPTVVVLLQCPVVVEEEDGTLRECEQLTSLGPLCRQHGIELLGLEVKASGIPNAGLGLFTTRPRRARERIDEYRGQMVSNAQYNSHPSAYGVQISLQRVINPIRSVDCFARFANDQRSNRKNNTELLSDRQYGLRYARPRYNNGSGAKVWLVTTKAVTAGSELFCNYGGACYWRDGA
jgi:hypothetical protein